MFTKVGSRRASSFGTCALLAVSVSVLVQLPSTAQTSRTETVAAKIRNSATSKKLPVKTAATLNYQESLAGPFGTSSVWKTNISSAPLASNSKEMVAKLAGQAASLYGGIAAFNVWNYNTSFYSVTASQKRVDVKWDDCQGKGYVPAGLFGSGGQFMSVPIPDDAVPAAGTDSSLSIYQPSSDTMWDFWLAKKNLDGWHACWGGRMDKVSQAGGWFPGRFGASASGLSQIGGSLGIREAQAGRVNHALALHIPRPAVWYDVSWPAQRSDGMDTGPNGIPEGTRLRLDPSVDVSKLGLHPLAKMIAVAAQKYGFIVTDKSGCVAVVTESGEATRAVTGVNPWDKLLNGTPNYRVMQGFPWDKLQALPKDYGKPIALK